MKIVYLFIAGLIWLTIQVQAQTVVDADSNNYATVTIGTQNWMAENLRTTRLNDSLAIPLIKDDKKWAAIFAPAYSFYDHSPGNRAAYGLLYNWYTVNTGKLCPIGWHVPSDSDWTVLEVYLQNNGFNYDGTDDKDNDRETNNKIACSLISATQWQLPTDEGNMGSPPNAVDRNKTGFNALPGGVRYATGRFSLAGNSGFWWTSDKNEAGLAWARYLRYNHSEMSRGCVSKQIGHSVRCLKD
jgi:uncharacterized protein (TIGR02145 family)